MSTAAETGRMGELRAAEYLRGKGYELITLNYRTRYGEIDIVARKDGCIVFVEVKTRKNASFATAREYVGTLKRKRLITSARIWLANDKSGLQPRFDVIEVYTSSGRLNHIENAFGLDG